MEQFNDLVNRMNEAKTAFTSGFGELSEKFDKQQEDETGRVSLDNGYLEKQHADFSLYYTLSETMKQCDRLMKEKPSREISLVKTKLQEAYYWMTECK